MNETFAFFYALTTRRVKQWQSEEVRCGECNGRGRKWCDACQGVGSTVDKCAHCDGCKRTTCVACKNDPATCGRCGGDGTVLLPSRPMIHPADTWTLRSVRSLSINGSFT